MKKCSKCKRSGPEVRFRKDSTQVDGLASACTDCKATADAAKYARDPEKARAYRKANQPAATTRAFQRYWADPIKARKEAALRRAKRPSSLEQKAKAAACTREWYANNKDRARAYHAANADRVRDLRFRREYGITLAAYNEMLAKQNGVCAICKDPPARQWLSVDHCHNTKAVRGLLCQHCNIAIGWLKHSPALLVAAKNYLMPVGSDEHLEALFLQ